MSNPLELLCLLLFIGLLSCLRTENCLFIENSVAFFDGADGPLLHFSHDSLRGYYYRIEAPTSALSSSPSASIFGFEGGPSATSPSSCLFSIDCSIPASVIAPHLTKHA